MNQKNNNSSNTNDEEIKDNLCVCPNCGRTSGLEPDCAECDEQECPYCGFPAMIGLTDDYYESDNKFIDNSVFSNIYNKVKKLLTEGKTVKNPVSYVCNNCKTTVTPQIYEHESGVCVKCGDKMIGLQEHLNLTEKRAKCVNCNSSYVYENHMNSCLACGGLLQIFAPLEYKKQSEIEPKTIG